MSYMSRLAWVFLGLWLLGLAPASSQEKLTNKPWTGKLEDGRVITEKKMKKILQSHELWLESHGKKGELAWLWKADLAGAPISGIKIGSANLSWADLEEANLSGAYLSYANLKNANLKGANLSGAYIDETDLSRTELQQANLSRAGLEEANLTEANLEEANLTEANLQAANLSRARLRKANLNRADLRGSKLTMALLINVNLKGVDLNGADLSGARFEPKPGSLPGANGLLYLQGLDSLNFEGTSSYGLRELREIYKNAGMRDQERQVTYALNHNRRINGWQESRNKDLVTREIARIENVFQLIFFEWACDWGMSPGRPLLIMIAGIFVLTLPYLLALRSRNPRNGIWLILLIDRILDRQIKDRPVKLTFRPPFHPLPAKWWDIFVARSRRVWRALRLALYFSLLSAFNIGWRELNVGNWITRIQKREYLLRGTGWVRMLSGLQALLSVYLLALWALTYFSRPFE